MAEIRLEHVQKRFDEFVAVRDSNLVVGHGQFFVLLGPSGCGKTTTLRMIAGLEMPSAGEIFVDGRDVTELRASQRDIAFVFQQYSLYPHYKVFDNLAFPLRAPGRKWPEDRIRARVEEVAALLRIEAKLDNRATALSGGEMQRVAIGRALVREPQIHLMDEPLSSLDAKLREDLRIELKRIQTDLGATILYVTHDQVEAMTLADRIGVLNEGVLVQIGAPREVYEAPRDTYVARRLGSPQINLVPPQALGLADGPAGTATVGVRPEDVILGRGGPPAEVRTVEHLGAETVALVALGEHQMHALLAPGDRLAPGESATVSTRAGSLLYFDAAGERLDAPRAARADVPERAYGT